MDLHPDCTPLAFLLGTWKGRGAGEYPTIESFEYLEEVNFGHVGKPFLTYSQRTRHAETGEPLHAEFGYMRVTADGMDLALVQPTGIIETHRMTLGADATSLRLELEAVSFSPTAGVAAKSVTGVSREITVVDDELRYAIAMAASGHPMTHHLKAVLRREE